ncbi:hypothetical protein MPLSOD_10449 [Mesorhizobium sp. SOD10]|nr:hypothetical protein MPLSOD_10449 [Mesorhizobium sp. SOD10]
MQRQGVAHAGQAKTALGVDRHHLVHAHLATLDAQIEDGAVEVGIDGGIVADGLVLARTFEREIGLAAERGLCALALRHPLTEGLVGQAVEGKAHAGEAGAAVIGREAGIGARTVDDGVQLRLHARHGIDLPGKGGNVEGVHHRGRGDAEVDRLVDRRGELVDGGNAVIWIDEEPFPIERDDLDPERLMALRDRLSSLDPIDAPVGIEQMRAEPSERAKAYDDEQRRRPDHQLQLGRMVPVGRVGRFRARLPVTPGKEYGQRHDGHDDEQHQQGRDDEQVTLLHCHVARGRQHDEVAAAEQHGQGKQEQDSGSFHQTLPSMGLQQVFAGCDAIWTNGYCRRQRNDIGQFVQCPVGTALTKLATHYGMTIASRTRHVPDELGGNGQDG